MNYTKEQLEMMSAEDLDTIIGGGAVDMSKYEKKADDAWMPKPHVANAGDFAGQGEMGIADTAANMVEQTGLDASDSTAANFLTNTANTLSGNLIPNVRKRSLQTLARGFYEDADGKRRYLEWAPEEQDYLLDKAMSDGWTGLARAAGSATGGLFGGKAIGGNALMKEWEDGEGKKYERGSTEWSIARLKHAQNLASMMLGDTVATEQNAQTEAAERGSTAAANIVAKGAPNLAYTAAYLSPWGIALNTALGAAGKAEGLQTDAMAYDEDGNLVTTAKGDTAGTAWLKGSASSLAEMGSELVGGKIGGAVVGRALRPLKNAAGRAVGSTAAGRSVLRFGERIGNLFERTSRRAHLENPFEENLEELETAWFDALLGTDKRDSELKGTNPLGRFADATKEFFTPKNLLELNEAMLLTMGAGAFVAAATDRGEYRASRGTLATGRGETEAQMSGKRVDDIIRAHELLTEEQMKDATTEEKTAALNAWIQGLSEDEIRQKIDAATGLVDRLANRIEGRNKFADNVAAIAGEMENAQGKNRFSDLTLSSPEAGSFDFASVAGVPEKDDKGNAVTAYADPQSGVRVEESVDGDGDVRYRVRGANGAYVAGPGGKAYMTDAAEAAAVADRAAREQNIRVLERADKENFVRSEIGRIGIPGKYEVKATMDEVKNLVPGIENDKNYDPNNPSVEIPAGSVLSDGTRTDAPFTVYVLDNIGTRDEATRKVIHEAGIHLMLDQAFENEDDRAKFLFGIDKRAIRYGVDYVARAYGKTADEVLDDPFLREEALAHSAEAATSTPTMLGKFVHAFREMARGMGAEIPLNDEELGVALREMRGKMFGSPEIGAVQAGIDERKETMRKLYEQGEADKAIAEGWAENQDDGVAGENAEGGELARMEEEQRRREKRSAEAIDAQAKANPNVPNEDQSKFDYRAKITVSPAPKEETKKMPIYSDMEYNGHKVKVGPLLRGGKEWGRLIELPDGNVILAQGAKSNRAALNQMRKALDRLLPNKNKSNSKEGPKTARSVNWGPSDFVEWVRSTKHRNPRYEDLDEYRAYVERKAEEAKAEKERAAKDKAHAERQKQIEDAFKWGEYGFVKWVRDTKGREPNEKDFYADLQEYEAYKANEEKSAMDAADEAAREAEHKRIKADIEHAFGERDKELRRERSHRAKRAAYKRSIRRFIEEHGNAYPALDYWLENGRKMISGADQEAQEALARYSSAERMFLAGFGNGGTGYDELLENFVNQYRNQETTNERHYDGDMTVEDILDQAISEWRKYQQWVKDGAKSAAEEELEGLEAADHEARRKLAAEDAQIKEYALDEIAAKEAWEKEYADAVGFIENEWNAAEEAKLSPENLAKCEIGINAIRIDHHDKVFYFAGWDAEDGILTLVDPDAEDGNRVYYRVTADGIQEAKANGQRNETGTADNRAGAADAGSEEGGGKEEAGKGKGGGFKLKSATAGEIAAEEKRNAERKEIERRNDAPLKAGKGETGQSLLDLGGAEGEDLFNRTERTDDAKDEFAKIKDGAKDSEALSAAVEEKAKEYEREAENWEKREYKPTDRTVEVDGEERRVDELNEERRKKKVAELRGKADALRKALADDVKGAKDAAYRAWLKKYGLNDTEARRKEFDKKQNGKSNPAGAAASARRIPAGEGELTDAERAWLGKTEIGKAIVSNYDSSVGDDKDFAVRQLRRSIENNKDALGAPPVKADAKPSAAMDAKAANKVLGMDAALGDAELRRKMAAWDAHRDERPGFAQKADAAKAILAYRAAKGKADARSTEVAARPKPEAATAAKEEAENDGTPRSREGLADVLEASGEVGAEDVGRIVKSATDAEVSALFDAYDTDEVGAAAGEVLDAIARREAKADADAEAANAGGKKDGGAPSVPTDEGFAAWATGRDGKPMSFASEEERANARATFDGLVRRGRVDGKTGRSNVRWSRSGIYTGSAADYEKPSLIHVGTGEGSQVYGWGLYGSTRRGIAEHYASVAHGNNTVLGIQPHDRKALESRSEKLLRSFNVDDYVIQNVKSCVYEPDAKSFAIAQLEDAGYNDSSEVHQAIGNLFDEYRKSKYVYEQTFFTNRAEGDESHLLSWYEPVSEENAKRIVSRVKVEFPNNGLLGKMTASEWMGMSGADAYKMIAEELQDPSYLASLGQGYRVKSPEQTASEFLARADIDGIKYPVDSYGGKDVKDGDKVGWNYVSFRDDNIRVDHKWVDGKQRWSKAADGVPADVREELHGITQERINYYRAKVGLPPLESKRRTLEEMGREGQGLFANRDLVNTIVDAVSKKPRALSEEETVAIDLANAELEQQYDLKMAQVDEAMLRGNKADELRLRSEADALRDRIDKFGRALRDTGSVTGRALALRRLMVSRNLTLAGFTSECEALKGKALTDEEKKDVAAAYRAVRDAIAGKDGAVLRELTKRIRDAAASDVSAIVAELKRRGAKSVPADVDGKFNDAVKQLVAWNDVSGGILTGLKGAKDTVNGIIRYHVANGVGENLTGKAKYDAVMGATLGTVKQYLGGATMEELEQAVSGYGISRPLSLDETELAVRDMDLQAKRYRALADLLNRKFPKATGDRRAPTSDEVKRLDAEIREKANELKMQAGLSPEEMQKLVDKRLATLESRLQNYRVMLMTENFKPKDRRAPRIMTPEIMAKEKEVAAAMKKVEERKKHYRAFNHPLNFRVGQNYASDWLNMLLAAPRVFRTMLDLSATGAQGASLFVSHPVEGMKALGKSVAAFYSSKKADELQLAMDADPDWQEFQKFGGHAYSISDIALDAVPEEFRAADTSVKIGGKTYSLDTLPFGIGKAVRSSERSFGAFLNAMNLAMYKAMKNGGGWSDPAGPTDTQKRDLAEALNVASGYGYGREGKGWWDKVMSATFWAPRYTVAGVKQAVGYEVWSPFLRGGKDERSFKDRAVASKQLAKEEARRLASMAAWTLLATLLFGKKDPEWIEEILDPRSGHFGNVRIGNREVSFLGPMKQWLTFMSRMVNGNTVKNGVKKDAGRFESIGRLIRGKMSPLFGLGWDLASGEDYIGDKVEWGRLTSGKNAEGKNAVGAVPHILESVGYPLSLNDVHEAIKEDGIANALLMAPFAITGFAKNSAPVNDYNLVTDTYEKLSGEYGTALRNDPKKARQMLKDNPELRDRSRINDLMKYVRSFERQAKKYEDAGKEVPEGISRRIEDYKRRAIAAVRKARGAK